MANCSEEVFVISKIKNIVPWTYVISDLNGEKIVGTFYEKELQKANQNEFQIEKVTKRKGDELFLKWKDMIIHLIVGLIKKKHLKKFPCIKMNQYFPKPFRNFGGNINVKVDLSNYATKTYIKNISHLDTSNFALKTNSASLKTEVDKLGIDKLMPVPVDLRKLSSNVVKDEVVKKTVW